MNPEDQRKAEELATTQQAQDKLAAAKAEQAVKDLNANLTDLSASGAKKDNVEGAAKALDEKAKGPKPEGVNPSGAKPGADGKLKTESKDPFTQALVDWYNFMFAKKKGGKNDSSSLIKKGIEKILNSKAAKGTAAGFGMVAKGLSNGGKDLYENMTTLDKQTFEKGVAMMADQVKGAQADFEANPNPSPSPSPDQYDVDDDAEVKAGDEAEVKGDKSPLQWNPADGDTPASVKYVAADDPELDEDEEFETYFEEPGEEAAAEKTTTIATTAAPESERSSSFSPTPSGGGDEG